MNTYTPTRYEFYYESANGSGFVTFRASSFDEALALAKAWRPDASFDFVGAW